MHHLITCDDAIHALQALLDDNTRVHLTFLDPPFNQGKEYDNHDDAMSYDEYWRWMNEICKITYDLSFEGASMYFMQREKNVKEVIESLEHGGWTMRNLVIWKKMASVMPGGTGFGKQYQIIVFAVKGDNPSTFHKLKIDRPMPPHYKIKVNGVYVTDVWMDIRELTSGYLAGDEAIRDENGNRVHKQQAPIELLLRIILASSNPGDVVLDPFSGSGTTAVVAKQLERDYITIENSVNNCEIIHNRVNHIREADDISRLAKYYRYTPDLKQFWPEVSKHVSFTKRIDKWFQG